MLSKANLACLVSLRANTFYNLSIYLSYCTIDVIALNKSVLLLKKKIFKIVKFKNASDNVFKISYNTLL